MTKVVGCLSHFIKIVRKIQLGSCRTKGSVSHRNYAPATPGDWEMIVPAAPVVIRCLLYLRMVK